MSQTLVTCYTINTLLLLHSGDLIDKETGPMTSSFELVYIYIGDKTSSLPEELTETAENTEVELRWLTGRSLISPFQCDK